MKNLLLLIFILSFTFTYGQDAGIEKKDKDGKTAWYATNSSEKRVQIEYKLVFYLCDGTSKTYIKKISVSPKKSLFLNYYKNVCFTDNKSYRKYSVLSKKIVE